MNFEDFIEIDIKNDNMDINCKIFQTFFLILLTKSQNYPMFLKLRLHTFRNTFVFLISISF